MKVDGFTVAMESQYYSYKSASTQISNIQTRSNEFQSDVPVKMDKVAKLEKRDTSAENGIIKELTGSLLKSLHERTKQDRLEISSTYFEAQALNFEATAYIKTADKEIALNLQVSLSRSFVQQTKLSFSGEKIMQDPLVLNLDGAMPSLSSKTFAFDIDSDGKEDQISMLGANSAFLALDKNSNGKIDNGSELFGAKTGDGFGELSKYDDDKNGWIDENDAIFDKLRIWKKSDGKDELVALGEVGIGAIFLGNIATPFELKDSANAQLGQLKNSGFFVYENGKAGVMSQLDLAVSKESKDGLNKLTLLSEGLKKLKASSSYKTVSESNGDDMNKRLEKLQKQLRSLEQKLATAKDDEKIPIQVRIGALYAQMMSIISEQYKAS